ncbi:hypothetical protein H9P43_001732 [Blastocladiella emersonii ATCC 22665]|nr:hypothetical protein H9P43_001732 [Blastocladiella emersonii ATCC 22665]
MTSTLAHVPILPPLAKAKEVLFTVEDEYIFDVACSGPHVAVSASNHQIKLYDVQLNLQGSLTGHTGTISGLSFHPTDSNLLFSSSHDGSVLCWDLRAPVSPAQAWKVPNRQSFFSHSVNAAGTMIAAGTELAGCDAFVHFYDPRMPAIQHSFSESFADDVTLLAFHPTQANRLLSGSTDGVACVFDLATWDEDEDLVASMQSGSSVNKLGWFGPAGEFVWLTTHVETFSLWSAEGDLLKDFGDIRQLSTEEVPINYAVQCQYDAAAQRLFLTTGSHEGALSVLHVTLNELQLCFSAGHAHTDVVRSASLDFAKGCMISGGEDSKLSLWLPNPAAPAITPANAVAASSAAVVAPEPAAAAAAPSPATKAFRGGSGRAEGKGKKTSPYAR